MATAEENSDEEEKPPLNTLLENLDRFASKIASATENKTNATISVEKTNMAFTLAKSFSNDITVFVQDDQSSSDVRINSESKIVEDETSWISSLHARNVKELNGSTFYSYFYREPTLFQGKDGENNFRIVGSNVLSFTISKNLQQIKALTNPINLTFIRREIDLHDNSIVSKNCSYWSFDKGDKFFLYS